MTGTMLQGETVFPCSLLLFALTKLLLTEPEHLTEISNFTYWRSGLGRTFADRELLLIFPESRGPPHILIL
jgi:hypothetical protein